MAERYWVGGGGNWSDDDNHWATSSGGTPANGNFPTNADNVTIDSNSGFGGGGTISLDGAYGSAVCHDFTSTSGHNYTIDYVTSDIDIYGSAIFESGLSWSSGTWTQLCTNDSETITTNGCEIYYARFNQDSNDVYFDGTYTLQDALVVTTFVTHDGTFDANDNNVTANQIIYYAIGTGTTTTVIMGSGTWEAKDISGIAFICDESLGTITVTPETSTIKLSGSTSSSYIRIKGEGKTFHNIWFSGTASGTGRYEIEDSNTFNDLKIDGPNILKFQEGKTTTVSSFTVNGTAGNIVTIDSLSAATQHTLSKASGVVECDYLNLSYSNATGGAVWYAGANSVDTTNNDGWIFGVLATKTFTVDGIVKQIATKTFTADGIIFATNTKTFTADGVVLALTTKTFTIDGLVKEIHTETFTIDGIVRAEQTTTFTIDAIVKVVATETFTIDGVVKATQTAPFTADGHIIFREVYDYTIDGIVKQIVSKSFTVDGYIVFRETKTFTIDGVVKEVKTKTFTIDAIVLVEQTQTFTIDGVIEEIGQKTFTIDGIVLVEQTQTFTIDGLVKIIVTKTFTIDGIVEEVGVISFTIDGIILATQEKTFTIDGVISEVKTTTFTIDGIIEEVKTQTFTVDGVVEAAQTQTFTVDGIVFAETIKTFTIDGVVVLETYTKTFTIDGIIVEVKTKTFTIDGIIISRKTESFTTDGIVVNRVILRDDWAVRYEADELPQDSTPSWTKTETGSPDESISDGVLNIIASFDERIHYSITDSDLDGPTGTTLEAKIKVVSSEEDFEAFVAIGGISLVLTETDIALKYGKSQVRYPFDTTDDFHIYRLTTKGDVAKIYIDKNLVISRTVGAVAPTKITFGDDMLGFIGDPSSNSFWDYVYYRTDGAFAPPLTIDGIVFVTNIYPFTIDADVRLERTVHIDKTGERASKYGDKRAGRLHGRESGSKYRKEASPLY